MNKTIFNTLLKIIFLELISVYFQAVFERLVDIICDKMSDSLDTDPTLMSGGAKGQRLTDAPKGPQAANCNC